jgi:hypothetical protein
MQQPNKRAVANSSIGTGAAILSFSQIAQNVIGENSTRRGEAYPRHLVAGALKAIILYQQF